MHVLCRTSIRTSMTNLTKKIISNPVYNICYNCIIHYNQHIIISLLYQTLTYICKSRLYTFINYEHYDLLLLTQA